MATYPYISGTGNVAHMIAQLRKSFPQTVNAETVKKLGLAPNNESYVISVLQFIGLLDIDGKRTDIGHAALSKQKDEDFSAAFEQLVKKAYAGLFELHADGAWTLDNDDLITFFRESDKTSEVIGQRQAGTFRVLAALAGHGEAPSPKAKGTNGAPKPKVKSAKKAIKTDNNPQPAPISTPPTGEGIVSKNFGLSVRVEINLPADGSKETYDNIFKSIKENLLNG
jgi:hypothetical protein